VPVFAWLVQVLNVKQTLRGEGIGVTVVRPGFVHTKMTEGRSPAPLSTTPEKVADVIVSAVSSGNEQVWAPASA